MVKLSDEFGQHKIFGRPTKRNSVPHSKTLARRSGRPNTPPGFGVRRACAAFERATAQLRHGRTGRIENPTACGRPTKRNCVPHSKTLARWFGCPGISPGFGDFGELSRAVRRSGANSCSGCAKKKELIRRTRGNGI